MLASSPPPQRANKQSLFALSASLYYLAVLLCLHTQILLSHCNTECSYPRTLGTSIHLAYYTLVYYIVYYIVYYTVYLGLLYTSW